MASILCVSERPEDMETVEICLSDEGHEVVHAPDRIRAIEILLGRRFDAAVLFLGIKSREVRRLVPLLGRLDPKLPVLTVAEQDTVETQREIRRSGIFYHLTEPVNAPELREAIREAIARNEAQP